MGVMTMSPIEAYRELLDGIPHLDNASATRAAETVLQGTPWIWVEMPYNANAPALLREQADTLAWRRFEADRYITRQQIASHALFRAMTHLEPEDDDARKLLSYVARMLLGEIIEEWQAGWERWVKGQ